MSHKDIGIFVLGLVVCVAWLMGWVISLQDYCLWIAGICFVAMLVGLAYDKVGPSFPKIEVHAYPPGIPFPKTTPGQSYDLERISSLPALYWLVQAFLAIHREQHLDAWYGIGWSDLEKHLRRKEGLEDEQITQIRLTRGKLGLNGWIRLHWNGEIGNEDDLVIFLLPFLVNRIHAPNSGRSS